MAPVDVEEAVNVTVVSIQDNDAGGTILTLGLFVVTITKLVA